MKNKILSALLILSICAAYIPGRLTPVVRATETVVYSEDFESTEAGSVPPNVTTSIGAPLNPEAGKLCVVSDGANQALRSQHQTTARGTNSATVTLPSPVTGDFSLDVDLKFGDNTVKKQFVIYSPSGTAILTIGLVAGNSLEGVSSAKRLFSKVGASGAVTEMSAFPVDIAPNSTHHFKFDMVSASSVIYLTYDSYDPVAINVSGAGVAPGSLGIGSMGIFTYYNNAVAGNNRYFQIDNIVVKTKDETTVIPNRAPVVLNPISDITVMLGRAATADISAVFTDPDGDALTYTADTGTVTGNMWSFTASTVGTVPVTITATDPEGLFVTNTFYLIVSGKPMLVEAIADQYVKLGQTVDINLSAAFSNPGEGTLTYTADIGTVTGDMWTYPAGELGVFPVTVTAENADGSTSDTFRVIVNHEADTDNLVYYEDFETTPAGGLPDHTSLNIGAAFSGSGGIQVIEDGANKVLRNTHMTAGRGTNLATLTLPIQVTGNFTLDMDWKVSDNAIRRDFYIYTPNGAKLMNIRSESKSSALVAYVGSGATAVDVGYDLVDQQTHHFKFVLDTAYMVLYMTLDNNPAMIFELLDMGIEKNELGIGSIVIGSYYSSGVSGNRYSQIDNIQVRGSYTISEEDLEIVTDDAADFLWEYVSIEEIDSVTRSLNLRTKGRRGSTIIWSSSDETVIGSNGMVIRQATQKTVTLTATFKKGNSSVKKTFTVTVLPAEAQNYKDVYLEDFEGFTVGEKIIGAPGWTESTTPPTNLDTGVFSAADPLNASNKVMKGSCNHSGIQSYSGYTAIQALPQAYDGDYELSFDFMVDQRDTESRVDVVNNKGETLFAVKVAAGGAFAYGVDGVTMNLGEPTPTVGRWYRFKLLVSSTSRYVAWLIDDTLVATFRHSANVSENYGFAQLKYYFWVKKTGTGTMYIDNVKIRENLTSKLTLVFDEIDFTGFASGVEDDFPLLTRSASGAVISWSSDHEAIMIDGGTAKVNRPLPSEEDVNVTLTASASIDGAAVSRQYVVKVLHQYSDGESTERDARELLWSKISGEPQDAVTGEISLPKTGRQGTEIVWSASSVALEITEDTAVAVRGAADSEVVLTATVSKNGAQTVKTFPVVVVRKLADNLAYKRKVLAHSSQISNMPVAYAMDNNFQTAWSTLYADAAPLTVIDLGVKQPVDSIMISERSKNIKSFKVSASNDHLTYQAVYSFHKSAYTDKTETNVHGFSAVEARYFKIEIERVRSDEAILINEIQLYNSMLTDEQAVSFAKQIFDIHGRGSVTGHMLLPGTASHGVGVTYQSSNPGILGADGMVNRPADTTAVDLTVYFSKGSAAASKVITVTVIGINALAVPNNESYKTFDDVFAPMSNEAFFGVWNRDKNVWHIDYPGVLDYNENPEMTQIGEYVKAGDYTTARSALVHYYKTRDIGYKSVQSSRDYALADLYINNILTGSHTFIASATVPVELSEVSADVSSYVTAKGTYSLFIMQKFKHEAQVEFYSREAGEHAPVLEVEVNGQTRRYTAVADTYVSPDTHLRDNFGSEDRLYVKETFAEDPNTVSGGYGKLWTKDTKRAYLTFNLTDLNVNDRVTRAVIKLYGKSAKGSAEVLIWKEPVSSWKENEYTWFHTLNDTYSWNGQEIDWIYPSSMEYGGLVGQVPRFYMISPIVGSYHTTKDEYYAYHSIRQILNFIEGTKEYIGLGNLQATGIRGGSLVISFNKLIQSPHMTDDAAMAMIQYLWQVAKTLSLPSYFRADHNHGIYANRGLMRITMYFPEFSNHGEWKQLFIDRYNINLNTLVYGDGSYREATALYSAEVANNLLMAIDESKNSNFELDPYFVKKTSDLALYIAHLLTPTGTDPGYGDDEIGNNRVALLRNIATALGAEKVKYIYTNGQEGEHPGFTSKVYPDGKYLVMRDGYDRDAWLMHTNWSIGDGRSHTHPDNLSLVLYAHGKWLVADPGRFNYTDNPISNWLRLTTEAHNVVNINNTTQAMNSDTLNTFVSNDGFDFYVGSSKAVTDKTGAPLNYQRSVLFSKSKLFVVSDRLAPTDTTLANTYDQNWHFLVDSRIPNAYTNGSVRTYFPSGANLIISQADSAEVTYLKRDGYFSTTSAQAEVAQYATFRQEKPGTTTFDTVLYPIKAGENTTVTTNRISLDVPKDAATALDVTVNKAGSISKNIYYMTYEAAPASRAIGSLTYDGKAMLVEYSAAGKIDSISIVDGSELKSGGTTVLKSKNKVADLFMSYNWDEISLQSGTLTQSTIAGLEILTERKINSVTLNGKAVAFYQSGNTVTIGSVILQGGSTVTVTAQGSQKAGTTAADYEAAISYSYKNKGNAVSLFVAGGTTISGVSSWDGAMPRLQTGAATQTINGELVQTLVLDNKNLTFDTPYAVKIYKDDAVVLYGQNYKKLPVESIAAAKNSLTSNEVGIYSGSGYITLYAYKPVDVILYSAYISPPSLPSTVPPDKGTPGGEAPGGGGGGASGGGISIPTEPVINGNHTSSSVFNDIEGHWAKENIELMASLGVAKGDNGRFNPDQSITRAEFITFVVRLLGYEKEPYSAAFDDVSDADWYAGDVLTAYRHGLITGYDNQFRPTDLISREEVAVILSKLISADAPTDALTSYADHASVSEWARAALAGAVQSGIISGTDNATLAPKAFTTRAMAITMLARLYKNTNAANAVSATTQEPEKDSAPAQEHDDRTDEGNGADEDKSAEKEYQEDEIGGDDSGE